MGGEVICPYPYGSVEAFAWWDAYFDSKKSTAMQEIADRQEAEHFHKFDMRNRICIACGVYYRDYLNEKKVCLASDPNQLNAKLSNGSQPS